MHLLRGRASNLESDHRRTREMTERVSETGEWALRVWTPHRQVVFGRRDRRSEGYDRAREVARKHDFSVIEREVGGRAVAYTGTTVAFTLAEPVDNHRTGIQDRYERALDDVQTALRDCGVETARGEPEDSFCPGSHSLQVADGKVVGVAQRVRQDVATVAGVVLVDDSEVVADVLDAVYDALDVPFVPESVGAIDRAGGPTDSETVIRAIEDAFVDRDDATVTPLRET